MRTGLVTLATVVALGAAATLAGPARAATPEDCTSPIAELRTDTADETTTPSLAARSRTGLVTKAEARRDRLLGGPDLTV